MTDPDAIARAWARTKNARAERDKWRARVKAQAELAAAADQLADAAAALPDVVRTKELRAALGRWRRVRDKL